MGLIVLLAIIPVKLLRLEPHAATNAAIGVAPSFLGPAGLLFLVVSRAGRSAGSSLVHVTLLVAVLSLVLELMQLLPRPGVLAYVHYTFDYGDLVATVVGVAIAYAVSATMLRRPRPSDRMR